MKLTKSLLTRLADKAGISIGASDGSPYPSLDQLSEFITAFQTAATKKKKSRNAKRFNYGVGHYWSGDHGQVGFYAIHSSTNFYGTMDEAHELLEYVKRQSPEKDWKIFMLIELPA